MSVSCCEIYFVDKLQAVRSHRFLGALNLINVFILLNETASLHLDKREHQLNGMGSQKVIGLLIQF